jgi:hypothetical protein
VTILDAASAVKAAMGAPTGVLPPPSPA